MNLLMVLAGLPRVVIHLAGRGQFEPPCLTGLLPPAKDVAAGLSRQLQGQGRSHSSLQLVRLQGVTLGVQLPRLEEDEDEAEAEKN